MTLDDVTAAAKTFGDEQYTAGAQSVRPLVETLTEQRDNAIAASSAAAAQITDLQAQLAAAHASTGAQGAIQAESLAELRARGAQVPTGAREIKVSDGTELDDMTIGANDLLWWEEGTKVYYDASLGFLATGVGYVRGPKGQLLPVNSKRKGKAVDQWFSMLRATRGLVGLGPAAQLLPTPTTWTQPAQIPDKSGSDPGRLYYDSKKKPVKELVGAQETLLETVTADAYFGNFTLLGPGDLGGVAYNGIKLKKGGTVERVNGSGAWRGFAAVPNGETGLVAIGGGTYLVARMLIDGRDPATGKRTGPSPIMINSSAGGTIESVIAQCCSQGMPTNWNAQPKSVHRLVDFHSRWNADHCLNLEQVGAGVQILWDSGSAWRGKNPAHPSPDGIVTSKAHVGLDARGAVTLVLGDAVDVDEPTLTIDRYGPNKATFGKTAKITVPAGLKVA